jgi:hypothetical protein
MWDELTQYTHITSDINVRIKEVEQDKTFTMLTGLDSAYDMVKGQILMASEFFLALLLALSFKKNRQGEG